VNQLAAAKLSKTPGESGDWEAVGLSNVSTERVVAAGQQQVAPLGLSGCFDLSSAAEVVPITSGSSGGPALQQPLGLTQSGLDEREPRPTCDRSIGLRWPQSFRRDLSTSAGVWPARCLGKSDVVFWSSIVLIIAVAWGLFHVPRMHTPGPPDAGLLASPGFAIRNLTGRASLPTTWHLLSFYNETYQALLLTAHWGCRVDGHAGGVPEVRQALVSFGHAVLNLRGSMYDLHDGMWREGVHAPKKQLAATFSALTSVGLAADKLLDSVMMGGGDFSSDFDNAGMRVISRLQNPSLYLGWVEFEMYKEVVGEAVQEDRTGAKELDDAGTTNLDAASWRQSRVAEQVASVLESLIRALDNLVPLRAEGTPEAGVVNWCSVK